MDELKPEDIDTDQEDHIYDEACHICMARPLKQDYNNPFASVAMANHPKISSQRALGDAFG